MSKTQLRTVLAKARLATAVAALLNCTAYAGDLNLSNNLLQVSNINSDVSSVGIASRVTGVPKTTGIGIPDISFELTTASAPVDGTYSFRVGVVIDDDNSVRRIEAMIAQLNLAITNGAIDGSIPTGTALRVIGRNTDFTVEMNTTNPATDGPISVSGGAINFDAASFIQKIADTNAGLEDIINDFGSDTHYSYQIVAQQTGGPEDLRIGTVTGSSFAALPCINSGAEVFEINNSIAPSFSKAFGIQGQFSISGAAGVPGPAPSQFSATCVEGSSGTSTLDQATSSLAALSNSIVVPPSAALDQDALDSLQQALSSALALTELAAAETTDTSAALSALEALLSPLEIASIALERGNNLELSSLTTLLDALSASITALSNTHSLNSIELDRISSLNNNVLASASAAATIATQLDQQASLHSSYQGLLRNALAAGASLSSDTLQYAQSLSETLATHYINASALNTGISIDFNNESQAIELARNNNFIKDALLRYSLDISTLAPLPSSAAQSALQSLGLDEATAASIAQNISNSLLSPGDLSLDNSLNIDLSTLLSSAFSNTSVSYDATTGQIQLLGNDSRLSLQAHRLVLAPATLGSGLSILANGHWLITNNGLGIELSPLALDSLPFYSALEQALLPMNVNADGSINVDLGNGIRFSGIFSFNYLPLGSSQCQDFTLTAPQGDEHDPDYRYQIDCASGASQTLLPYMFTQGLYEFGSSTGFNMSTDLGSGIFTIEGFGQFKPSYLVHSPSAADLEFLQLHQSAQGVAFRAGFFNEDEVLDFEMISANGKQTLFGLNEP
ncbi:MAG: hypothetical protein R3332_13845 [Pseudohongiellaceae bacterium]|nr:hypothetical protein [Pseudohongiellaceae bacterium]